MIVLATPPLTFTQLFLWHKLSSPLEKFILFLISEEGQRSIGNFKKNNEILFTPIFGKTELIGLQSEKDSIEYWEDKLYNK